MPMVIILSGQFLQKVKNCARHVASDHDGHKRE